MRASEPDPTPFGTPAPAKTRLLLRDVLRFQVKLWLEALRDIVLSPVTLAAAALDFAMVKRQSPRYFRTMLTLGRRSEDWIDLWSQVDAGAKPESVDALLAQIEQVVRDPRAGQRKARVLLRWAEMNIARQGRKPGTPRTAIPQAVVPPPPPGEPPMA